jgi:hypothetical protein
MREKGGRRQEKGYADWRRREIGAGRREKREKGEGRKKQAGDEIRGMQTG